MKELQGHAELLQLENDQLWAQIEKIRDLGKMYEIMVEVRFQPFAIKGRSPLFLMMSIPQQMMSCPHAVPHH